MADESANGSPWWRTIFGSTSMASARTWNSSCTVPNWRAIWRACGSSSKPSWSKPIEKVRTGSEGGRGLARHDGRGVDAAREEGAERDVGDEPSARGGQQALANALAQLLDGLVE